MNAPPPLLLLLLVVFSTGKEHATCHVCTLMPTAATAKVLRSPFSRLSLGRKAAADPQQQRQDVGGKRTPMLRLKHVRTCVRALTCALASLRLEEPSREIIMRSSPVMICP